ncbi:MAG: sodium-translocating pyrophosphatase, partial [Gammaproteobacteria bacterium]
MDMTFIPLTMGGIGLLAAFVVYRLVVAHEAGSGKVVEIGEQIYAGAMAFISREYKLMWGIAVVVLLAIGFSDLGWDTALSFFVGAFCSSVAGFIGMHTATKANVRTTTAAHEKGADAALTVAFFGGSVMGITVAAMGLLGLGFLYILYGGDPHTAETIHGFGMGASLVALFSRVGGGIYTKSADVGADLVGKLEAGIPEDDPRNPGVIADNVGDNVGDVAGMGSDIFESYCGSMIATIAMAATLPALVVESLGARQDLMALPLLLASVGLVCSLIGVALVRLASDMAPEKALRMGTIGAAVLFIIATWFVLGTMGISNGVWIAVLAGAVGGMIIGLVTEYYTGGQPVRDIAKSGETGPATVMISGLAVGMQSVVVPVLSIAAIIFISNWAVGLYGVGIAAVGMLATVGMTMAIDAYGPVADNAGGIAEMAGLGKETREITDSLDEVGNTTAAIGKGFAIGAAALA